MAIKNTWIMRTVRIENVWHIGAKDGVPGYVITGCGIFAPTTPDIVSNTHRWIPAESDRPAIAPRGETVCQSCQ